MKLAAILLVVCVASVFAAAAAQEGPQIARMTVTHLGANGKNNSYVYAMSKCNPPAGQWGIHGLWPEWGMSCPGAAFDVKQLASIRSELDKKWVSCNGDNPAFWKHEWSKHGTCANMTQLEYFQTGLKLHQRYVDQCDDDAKKRNSKYIDCRICLDMKLNQYDC